MNASDQVLLDEAQRLIHMAEYLYPEPFERKRRAAAGLRSLAANLWDVEYRIRVDEDARLLLEAANLLDGADGAGTP